MANVEHDAESNAYFLVVDGERIGTANYVISDDTITFTHTEIDPEKREAGMGSELVEGALENVRTATEYRVVAQCPFVSSWIEEHPEYADLLSR
jgi:predicted GNAT family acetyltransferase